jgi:hypothetical protein
VYALALPAASHGGVVRRRTIADAAAPGPYASATVGQVALDRRWAGDGISAGGRAALASVDSSRDAGGAFDCGDHRVSAASIAQGGAALSVRLVKRTPAPTAECAAISETFQLRVVPKSSPARPYPTPAVVTGA